MADQVLMRVPLRLQSPKDDIAAESESARIRAGNLAGVLKEINATCFEYQREEVRRMICKVRFGMNHCCFGTSCVFQIAAQTFMKEKDYGMAVSYCTSAEDWPGLGRVVDRVLEEYVLQGNYRSPHPTFSLGSPALHVGPEKFARLVANIAPSLHTLRAEQGSSANGIFIYRLMFAVRFAEFHQRRMNGDLQDAAFDLVTMFQEDIAPKSWWAVLLCDAVQLLQHSA